MTKRWSSVRSDLTKTKRQASKERRREDKPDAVHRMEGDNEVLEIYNWFPKSKK